VVRALRQVKKQKPFKIKHLKGFLIAIESVSACGNFYWSAALFRE
jgi:hypothetical protein